MIDAQERNKQRKILTTITYNDLGIILDVKVEELDSSADLQPTCNQLATDCISRQDAIDVIRFECGEWTGLAKTIENKINELPSAQPTQPNTPNTLKALDCISRKDAIDLIEDIETKRLKGEIGLMYAPAIKGLKALPSAQPEIEERMSETEQNVPNDDFISRKRAIDAIEAVFPVDPMKSEYAQGIACGAALSKTYIEQLPSAQPERTCVNCGRTINNGGWYADGRTRCPIEEHYALPKDGYCHLWEKRNVTDDDYPERREE